MKTRETTKSYFGQELEFVGSFMIFGDLLEKFNTFNGFGALGGIVRSTFLELRQEFLFNANWVQLWTPYPDIVHGALEVHRVASDNVFVGDSITCKDCGKTFTSTSGLNTHRRNEHGGPFLFMCPFVLLSSFRFVCSGCHLEIRVTG